MKKYAVFLFAVFAMERIMAQDPADLLLKSRAKCLELNKVYYEMTEWFKPMTDKDTGITTSICWMKKVKEDQVFGCFFHYHYSYNGQGNGDAIYTGEELLSSWSGDSSAQLIPVKQYPDYVQSIAQDIPAVPGQGLFPLCKRRWIPEEGIRHSIAGRRECGRYTLLSYLDDPGSEDI